MNLYRGLLILLALAAAGAIAWTVLAADPGYVLISAHGWSVETTLIVAVVAVLLTGAVLYAVWWLLRTPWVLWRRARRRAARERLAAGLLAVHEGRWLRAEKLLTRAAGDPALRLPALLAAARAASERGDRARTDALLARAAAAGGEQDAALLGADRLLVHGQHATACEMLEAAARRGPLPPRALELRGRALAACGRAAEALELLPELRRSQVREGDALVALEAEIGCAALEQATTLAELDERWHTLSRAQRLQPLLVAAYARRAAALDDPARAAEAIEAAQRKQWSEALAALYGALAPRDRGAPLRTAEQWLAAHPDSAGVLLCLGRLCRRERIWGKAEEFLARALQHGAGSEAWETLAEVFAEQGDESRALQAYANALRAVRNEPLQPMQRVQRRIAEETVIEERTSMGLPRLPAE